MRTKTIVRCPNCGELAQRESLNQFLSDFLKCSGKTIIKTECQFCDYLMVMNLDDGQVIEAYAPGISSKIMLQTSLY